MAKALLLCALPYRRAVDEDGKPMRSVTRVARLGDGSRLSVTFSTLGSGGELAFGSDRAVLGWILTHAYETGSCSFRRLRDFLRAFGLDEGGRSYRAFRSRIDRLSRLAVRITQTGEHTQSIENRVAISSAYLPSSPRRQVQSEDVGQGALFDERFGFELDPSFWSYLRANPVPLPLDLMKIFHGRPMAWDFTSFVLYRSYVAKAPSTIPMRVFSGQFGSGDKTPRRLKWRLGKILKQVQVVYPSLPARFTEQGLRVAPWRPERKGKA